MKLLIIKMLHRMKLIIFYVFNMLRYDKLEYLSYIARPLRIHGRQYISVGRRTTINRMSWLVALKIDEHEPSLTFGTGCAIGDFNHIAAVRNVNIGDHVLTANGVYISDNLHDYKDIHTPVMHQPVIFKSAVSIGQGTWIGEHACIIGARIGKNCVIGANAVVTSDIPDYSVAVGAPARVIRRYNVDKKAWEDILT